MDKKQCSACGVRLVVINGHVMVITEGPGGINYLQLGLKEKPKACKAEVCCLMVDLEGEK